MELSIADFCVTLTLTQIGGMPEAIIQQLGAFCGVRSTVFEVEVVAEIEGQQRTFSSMLHRVSAKDVRILYFQWK